MVSTSDGKFIQYHLNRENGWGGHPSAIASAVSRTIHDRQRGPKVQTMAMEDLFFVWVQARLSGT